MGASIEISEERGVRRLHFGSRWIQGAMRVGRPWALELQYTRDMMLPLLLRPDPGWPASVLDVGLGAASVVKFLHRHRPDAEQTVVEIEPSVIAAARQWFKLPEESARMRIEIGDGADLMAASTRHFDMILVDGYDAKGRCGALDTLAFYRHCRARLSTTGILATNLVTGRSGVRGSIERMRNAFGGRVLVLPPCDSGNVVALAGAGAAIDVELTELMRVAASLREETGLNLIPTLRRIAIAQGGGEGSLRF